MLRPAFSILAVSVLVLLPQVAAQVTVPKITIDPRHLLLNKAGAKITVAFTLTTALPVGGFINIIVGNQFYQMDQSGYSPATLLSCSVPQLSATFQSSVNQPTLNYETAIVMKTSGVSIPAGHAFTMIVANLTVGSVATSSSFKVSTSADPTVVYFPGGLAGNMNYKSCATTLSQISMTIADSDRVFSTAAAVTIQFTPSTTLVATSASWDNAVVLWFPKDFFRSPSNSLTYKSSISNSFLETMGQTSEYLAIRNAVRSQSPTGAPILANSACTITIFGLILDTPVNNNPSGVMLTTSVDSAANEAVDTGVIGFGSFVSGACPYGLTWDNSAKACSSCGTKVCGDFESCYSCVGCPAGLAIQESQSSSPNRPLTLYYACSNSSSLCPAGSGKQNGDSGGCTLCLADKYNDGSSGVCKSCPLGMYPRYQISKTSVLWRGAAACSSQCPEGTGVFNYEVKYQKANAQLNSNSGFTPNQLSNFALRLTGLWPNMIPSGYSDTFKEPACFPCGYWFVSKDNTCKPCNAGGSDRATLNSMGNTFAFATRCIPDICPWPYVVVGEPLMNEAMFQKIATYNADTPPEASNLPNLVCGVNMHLGGTNATIAVIAVVLFGTYAVAVSFAAVGDDEALTTTRRRKLVVGMLLTTLSPAVDFISDIMYIVSTLFFNSIICIVTCFFFLLPMFFFWRMLLKHGVHFSFYIGTAPAFAVKEKYDSIPKALVGLAGYLPLYIINLPVSLPLFLIGHVLYCCKVFPISRVSNLWLRLYTRSDKHASNVVILLPMLQESIFEEMLTESVPQMIIQIVNNTFTNVWTNLSYFSTAMSAMMILNGIWRLFYYRMYLKISITDIPNDLSEDIFKFASIEEGESSLAKAMSAKVAPSVELSSIVSAVGSHPHQSYVLLHNNRSADDRKRRIC